MDDLDARRDLYQRTREDLLKRQLSNSENFDRAILTLSSAALGLSLTFIKTQSIDGPCLLFCSLGFFVASIVVTLLSFLTSQAAIGVQLRFAEKYYLEGEEEFLSRKNVPAIVTKMSSYVSATTFVIAIVLLVVFIAFNTHGKDGLVTDSSESAAAKGLKNLQEGAGIPPMQKVDDGVVVSKGATIPDMQAVPPTSVGAGAPVPTMQQVPQPTSPVVDQPSAQQSSGPQADDSSGGKS